MAEDFESGGAEAAAEEGGDVPAEGGAAGLTAEASPAEAASAAPAPQAPGAAWSRLMVGMALAAVCLTVAGVLSHTTEQPSPFYLAAGLLAWGTLDLLGQGRGLFRWKGAAAAWGNVLNLVRAGSLFAGGGLLLAQSLGLLKPAPTSTLALAAVAAVGAYLLAAFALEVFVQGAAFTAQAALLAALALQIGSYLYFTQPFTYAWASVLAAASFGAALWSATKGSLEQAPATGRAVLTATLLLSAPFLTFTAQQMFATAMQPSFPPVLLIPRMHELAGGLAPGAGAPSWAPRHTKAEQPGDIPYSDKMAFIEPDAEGATVAVYVQHEDSGELIRTAVGGDARPGAWSPDGAHYAFTDKKGKKRRLRLLQGRGPSAADWTLATASDDDPAPGPDHGQVWLGAADFVYYGSPSVSLKKRSGAVFRADPKKKDLRQIGPQMRAWPAVSPDGKTLLSVGFSPNIRYLEIADGESGRPRRFKVEQEARYFPAWSANQTRVLFLKDGVLMTMKSNGTQAEPFNANSNLDSRRWLSESKELFTLQWRETGDRWQIWRSKPDGAGQKKIFEDFADMIIPPRWSPDSGRIAFALEQGGVSTVITMGPDGSWLRRCFSAEGSVRELGWSPDSLRLAFFLNRPGGRGQEAWSTAEDGLDPQKAFSSDGALSSLSWSPASKHIAFEEVHAWKFLGLRLVKPDLYDVHMVDLAEGTSKVMTRYGMMAAQPVFSPQGVSLAYFTDDKPWAPSLRRRRDRSLVVTQLY